MKARTWARAWLAVVVGGMCAIAACGPTDVLPDDSTGQHADGGTLPPDGIDAGDPDDADAGADGGIDAGLPPDDEADAGFEEDAGEPPIPPITCPTSAPNPPAFTGVNNSPDFLLVYDNNVENLEEPGDYCPGDWQDLIFYMKLHPSPDVFLVQQISGQAQLDDLVQVLTDKLPGIFAGIIAEASPDPMKSPCGVQKRYQTNAIIYRTGRLTPIGAKHVWQSWAYRDGACRRNFQARTKNVMQKFHDKVANRDVTVASIHWSTAQGSGPDPACAEKNVIEAEAKLRKSGYGGDLVIFGGDANEPDVKADGSARPWYKKVNGDTGGSLGMRDPIFAKCAASSTPKQCRDNNWTIGSDKRIDFVFARRGDGCLPITHRAHTVTFDEADTAAQQISGADAPQNYSDHRAIHAAIFY